MIALYLIAVVAANLIVAWQGAWITPITAFVFIGLDITARDRLHDRWNNNGLVWKMGGLIALGSGLSYAINTSSGRIAFASFVSFALSATVDAIVYHVLRRRESFEKINWSNLASGSMDSVLFPAIAFGWPPDMMIVYGQATAKIAGGLFWSLLLYRRSE